MSAPTTHTTPDESTFRISTIQAVRDQSLFRGQEFTFQVEQESGDGTVAAFEVKVTFSPIAIAIASPEDRVLTDDLAGVLVKRTLDEGNRQDLDIRITSDGAVKVGDKVENFTLPTVAGDTEKLLADGVDVNIFLFFT